MLVANDNEKVRKISAETLQGRLNNEEKVVIHKMHPVVQACLRIYHELRPGTVERFCKDRLQWVENRTSVANMFYEPYRLKDGAFDRHFIEVSVGYELSNCIVW